MFFSKWYFAIANQYITRYAREIFLKVYLINRERIYLQSSLVFLIIKLFYNEFTFRGYSSQL